MTAVGGPLVIAACTEFTSLILLRFVEERGRGYEPREAIDVTASRTGRAFIVSALTAIAGVAVLSFSSLPLLRDFGRIVAMNVDGRAAERARGAAADARLGRPAQPRVARADQEAAAVRRRAAGALPRAGPAPASGS